MTWIPVSERLPLDQSEVLVLIDGYDRAFCGWCSILPHRQWYQDDRFVYSSDGGHTADIEGVTHWCPLPDTTDTPLPPLNGS